MPHFAAVALLAFSLACSSSPRAEETAASHTASVASRRLNVIVVTIDTLRPDHLHCYGYTHIQTPVLDGVAQQGVLFENAVAQAPLTPPSHASIFTGQYPTVHKVRNTGGFVLPSGARPLAKILQEQGWDTAAFVSSAVLKKNVGFNNGFSVYDDQMPRQGNREEFTEDPERPGEETVDHAIKWLNGQSGKPYFLWVHLYDPHLPYTPRGVFKEQYKDSPYDGEIAYSDQQVGRLLEAVSKKSSVSQNIVAILSDHGESLSEHGEYTHGVFLYDATLHIAFLMSGPGIPSGQRVKQQVRSIDFLPTLLALLGEPTPQDIQGISLVPTFTGKNAPAEISYEETLYPKLALGWAELRAIRTNHWKYIRAPKPELYDLTRDPHETNNIITQNPAEVDRLEAQLRNVIGGKGSERVATAALDAHQMEQLRSLGYLSGFSPQQYDLTGQGPDPKDRVKILALIFQAENSRSKLPESRRIALLEEALREDPTNPSLYHQTGGELEKVGRYDDALRLYRNAIEHGVENGRLHSRIADLSLRKGDKAEAIAEYEKAARFNPSDPESQSNLGTAYLEEGKVAEAERVFKWVLTTNPDYPAANNGLGLVAIQKKDFDAARQYFEKAAGDDPDLVEAQMNLGLLYEMSGDRARARRHFEAFLAKASGGQYRDLIPKVKQELANLQ